MPTSIVQSIRVEASLDAANYVENARRKTDADDAMVDSGNKVNENLGVTERRLGSTGGAIGRFIQQNDAAFKATTQWQQGLDRLQRSLNANAISQETFNRQTELLNNRYAVNIANAQKAEEQQRELARTLGNTGAAMGSGRGMRAAASGSSAASVASQLSLTPLDCCSL